MVHALYLRGERQPRVTEAGSFRSPVVDDVGYQRHRHKDLKDEGKCL